MAALDRAKAAIQSDPDGALAQLDARGKKFGILGPEAMVVRLEALAAKGDSARAVAVSNEFLSKYPDSPHASRVRSIVAAHASSASSPSR